MVRNRRDLVMVNRMCIYEVQFNNRITIVPEKWPWRRNCHIWGRNLYKLGENQSTFEVESVHIGH